MEVGEKKNGSSSHLPQTSPEVSEIPICLQTNIEVQTKQQAEQQRLRLTAKSARCSSFQIQPSKQLLFSIHPDGGAELKGFLGNSDRQLFNLSLGPKHFSCIISYYPHTKTLQSRYFYSHLCTTNLKLREAKQLAQQAIPNIVGLGREYERKHI